jgi:iron complex transport system ATP-binding protein
MTVLLTTNALAVGYPRHAAIVSNLDLAVHRGEVVCLLGVNGAGKSTLLRTLCGMQKPLAGSVAIDGVDIASMSRLELARTVAVLLTERIAVGALPAYRLVELGLYPHVSWTGALSDMDRKAVTDAIAAVGAEHLANRDFRELSDGERQRIMIARALAQQPALLLLDEPAAYLDVLARVEMMATLRRLARERNVAVVLSSHDLELSLRTADTIWLIDRDGTLSAGTPDTLLANGAIEAAFTSPQVVFHPGTRSFDLREKL